MKYKCDQCFLVISEDDLMDGLCPKCGRVVKEMCPKDRLDCICGKDIHETIAYCETCGEAICPGCGCHDVFVVSRITGYLSELDGWNEGKKAEFKDRVRYKESGEIERSGIY